MKATDGAPSMQRRYDVDALRVIALALLIIYHIFVCYQPFANAIQFIQYDQLLTEYWFVAELFNIWRIPVLFVISGMAVGFVLRRRTVKGGQKGSNAKYKDWPRRPRLNERP